jgi:site-specific DNA-methyltransferase (adenine-specific)
MEIGGRSLPPGENLGERLATLRRRREIGRHFLAEMAGVSPTSLAAVEKTSSGRLTTVARIADALGTHLRLVPQYSAAPYWTGIAGSNVHNGWTTPREILERLYAVVGGPFGLDPCSPVRKGPRAPVQARLRYVAEDNGLSLPWIAASVYMNPPYGRLLRDWVAKAQEEAAAGRSGVVFGLIPARSDTGWWHDHIADVADIWMLRGRLSFGDSTEPAPFPSAIAVWSASKEHRARMAKAFPNAWHVPARNASLREEVAAAAD